MIVDDVTDGKSIVEMMGRAKGKFIVVFSKVKSFDSIDWLEKWMFEAVKASMKKKKKHICKLYKIS